MSRLGTLSEIDKLATTLELNRHDLDFLTEIAPEDLRSLRISIYERLFKQDAVLFERLAALTMRLPPRLAARLAEHSFGPLIAARIAAELPPGPAIAIARLVSITFFADTCAYLDPRRTRDMIVALPVQRIIDVGRELIERREFMTISRFIDFVTDEQTEAVIESIDDEAAILRIAFYMGSKNRMDHLFRTLPHERIERMVVRVQEEGEALLPAFLSVLIHVSYALKRDLGEIISAQGEDVLTGYIRATQDGGLWQDVLPVVATMSPEAQRRVVNLPILAAREVQEAIVTAADEHLQFGILLELARTMGERTRDALAEILARRGTEALKRAIEAALLGEHWCTLLDLARRMPPDSRSELARAIADMLAPHDPELLQRVSGTAQRLGLNDLDSAAGAHLISESRTGVSSASAYS
jgi:hypothetical protein